MRKADMFPTTAFGSTNATKGCKGASKSAKGKKGNKKNKFPMTAHGYSKSKKM